MSGQLGVLNILMNLDTAKFSMALDKSSYQMESFASKSKKELYGLGSAFQSLAESSKALNTKFNIVALNHGLSMFRDLSKMSIGVADSFGQYSSRLKQATADTEEFKAIQEQLLETSNRTFKNYEDATELFIRTSGVLKQLGYDAKTAADLVSTVQFGLTVDSADTQKTQSAINAISSAILEGKMDMQKFNSVVAASPSLFQALADSIAGGSQQALRQMVSAGQVTADQLVKVTSQMDMLGKKADEMPTTVADAMTKLQNNFAKFIGEANETYGATQLISSGIGVLADNLDIASAAVVGFGGAKLSQFVYAGAVAMNQATAANIANTKALLDNARANHADALAIVRKAEAEKIAAMGTSQQIIASANLADRRLELTQATKNLTHATKLYNAANSVTSRALSFVGGPVGLLTGALTVGAMAWTYFSRETEKAEERLIDINAPLDTTIDKIKTLNRFQLDAVKIQLDEDYTIQVDTVKNTFSELMRTINASSGTMREDIRKALWDIGRDTSLSAEEVYTAQLKLIEGWERTGGIVNENIEEVRVALIRFGEAREGLDNITKAAEQTKESINKLNQQKVIAPLPTGMEKWAEYLKNLEDTRKMIGMNARELAEFQAAQKGANAEQAKIAGIVGGQTDAYKRLEEAIKQKDSAAENAAIENIKNLEQERHKMELLIQKTAQLAVLANQLANGLIDKDFSDKMSAVVSNTFETALANLDQFVLSKEAQEQINRLKNNTKVTGGGKRSGGGGGRSGGGESELASLTKSLKEQVALFGMTDVEAQKYKISLMQGSEEAKAYAQSLVDMISAQKEQAETAKQARLMEEELNIFRAQSMLDITSMGVGEQAREQLRAEYQLREEFAQKRRELEEAQENESTRISNEAYQQRLEYLRQTEEEKLNIIQNSAQQRQQAEGNWLLGIQEGLNNYATQSQNVYAQLSGAVQNWASQSTDALTDFVMTGKGSFKDLANSIIKDLVRIFIQQRITGLFANALGGFLGGGGASLPTVTPTNFVSVGGMATGGFVRGPGTGTSDSIPTMLSNGEFVINARATKANLKLLEAINSGRVQYRAMGGAVGSVNLLPALQPMMGEQRPSDVIVNIHNNGSQPMTGNAKMSKDASGRMVIDIMLADLNGNGQYAQQLKSVMKSS
ncbi:phage tail tape measure protein [Pelistega ratti]|uniref:phage tail tape measure protein n=1 Tax=Pelistega ratti TaxID=2652177 RepID=UPI00135B45AE|nr:phage tail tape measure protein [Pelistega ratti]